MALYCPVHDSSFVCMEGMVKSVSWWTCMGCSPGVSKFLFSFKYSCIEKRQRHEIIANNDDELEITMATPKVKYWPQEASVDAL